MSDIKIGIIGGSGLSNIDGLKVIEKRDINTPFGKPSDSIVIGEIKGRKVAFLPRHGTGHFILPSEINFRANIYAFKVIGVEKLISVSAVGSMKEELKPRDIVIPDQLFDRTKLRISTFFGDGLVVHIPFAEPFCPELSNFLHQKIKELNIPVRSGGTYICIEGPQFSTKGESRIYRSWGVDIIGMTNIPEAKLAREAEICYVTLALVTDYDVWKEGEEVSVEKVLATMSHNIKNVKKILSSAIPEIPEERNCICVDVIKGSIQTSPEKITPELREKYKLFI